MGIIPAITGKVELVLRGEQEGAAAVAQHLLGDAIHTFFPAYFPKLKKRKKVKNGLQISSNGFFVESGFELVDDCSDAEYERILSSIVPLEVLIKNTNHNLKK
jgi:magnesium chelatase subunit I